MENIIEKRAFYALAMLNSTFLLYRNYNEPLYIADAVTDLQNQCQRFQGDASINTCLTVFRLGANTGRNTNRSVSTELQEWIAIHRARELIDASLPHFLNENRSFLSNLSIHFGDRFDKLSRSRFIVEIILERRRVSVVTRFIRSKFLRVHFS